jgi:cell division protein FtsI/penicillin-binding protein 2
MRRFSQWIGVGTALGVSLALVPVVRGGIDVRDPLRRLDAKGLLGRGTPPERPSLEGLDLLRLDVRPNKVTAPLTDGRKAELTIDPVLQRAVRAQMETYRLPESGVVMMEVRTGRVLAYASYVAQNEKFDVNTRAGAPAASIFKMVTGAAFVEKAGLNAETEQCYHGGKSRISPAELTDDPRRDKWCATLAIAMGRSINVVFARLAQKHLTPEDLTAVGGALGFGAPVPFVVPNQAPEIKLPQDPLEFARASAGFWHTTLSPLAGASLAQTIANGGIALEPRVVQAVTRDKEVIWKEDRPPRMLRRAVRPETAAEVTRMMLQTVSNGSGFKSFHDASGKAYLPDIAVAGKTGTLSDHAANRHYTWFVGFAPADKPEIAVSALVVNTPAWHIKAPQLARDSLRAYFAKAGRKGVTAP